jgi:hypothetical protein
VSEYRAAAIAGTVAALAPGSIITFWNLFGEGLSPAPWEAREKPPKVPMNPDLAASIG